MPTKRHDLTNKKFNHLTAIKLQGHNKWGSLKWLCKCDCGREIKISTGELTSVHKVGRKTCGNKDCDFYKKVWAIATEVRAITKRKDIKYLTIKMVLNATKHSALRRNLTFDVTYEDLERLIFSNCNYCGIEPSNLYVPKRTKNISLFYNGLDRIDSSQGYIKSNIMPCCWDCNMAKKDKTIQKWNNYIQRLIKFQTEKNKL